jgi:hypothetical protein
MIGGVQRAPGVFSGCCPVCRRGCQWLVWRARRRGDVLRAACADEWDCAAAVAEGSAADADCRCTEHE